MHAPYVAAVLETGAELRVESSWLNAVSVTCAPTELARVRELSFVRHTQPVRRLTTPPRELVALHDANPSSTYAGTTGAFHGAARAQLAQITVTDLHAAGFTGQGVIVGILDTGFVTTHVAFNNAAQPLQVVAAYDYVNNDTNVGPEAGDPPDQHHHGTYILGTLGARDPGVLVGAAYEASFILAKVEDIADEVPAKEDFFVLGLQVIEALGGDVARSSLIARDLYTQKELDGLTSVMTVGLNVATDNGVHCFQGAGNDGHDADPQVSHLQAPADAFETITVGAVASNGNTVSFSSDGPSADGRVKPEVLALGSSTQTVSATSDSNIVGVSGTSLSTPLVAGAAACLVQGHPEWSVARMRQALIQTAEDFVANGTHDPLFVRGYGIVDADAARRHEPGVASCFGVGCPCGNDDPAPIDRGCMNSTGSGGLLGASGSNSIAENDLVLDASGLPPSNNGLFYMGDTQVLSPFFDGVQCVLGVTFRFLDDIQVTGAGGTMTLGPGIAGSASSLIQPGSTWHFHAWHRDASPGPGPCGTGANLTNLYSVTFVP